MSAPHLSKKPPLPEGNPDIRIRSVRLLADNWYLLRLFSLDVRRSDGTWQKQEREAYDRGNGAAILLYSLAKGTIVLVRQFRLASYVNGHADGMILELPAGQLDDLSPAAAVRKETAEETGFVIGEARPVFDVFMSPGSVTERLHLFLAEYDPAARNGDGGGHADEGEDIQTLEVPFGEALAMIADGRIRDAKTIMMLYHLKLTGIMDRHA